MHFSFLNTEITIIMSNFMPLRKKGKHEEGQIIMLPEDVESSQKVENQKLDSVD